MKNILVLIKNNLRVDILKNPFGFLIGLLAPVLILYLMLMIIGGNSGYIKIGVIDNDSSNISFNINKESLNDLHSDYSSSQIYIGFLIMFMLIRGMRAAYRIFDEKDENIYMRIFMAPVRTSEYYLADVISGYITILIQVVLGIVSINLLNVETGLRNIQLFIILALVGLVSISLALCCSAFSRNKTEASNIFNFANMVLLMVGGAFVPLEIMPTLIEKISYFTPVRWAMKSISDIQQGYSFSETYKYLFTILLFAIVFFVVGSYKTSREEKKITIN